jgi:ArsR family transcriptional regulator
MNQLTSIYKTLSDETRLRILMLLYQEDLCVCQLSGILDASQPKISKNLSKLRDMNFVVDTRRDKFVYYALNKEQSALIKTLKGIDADYEKYPDLTQDRSKLVDKDKYLSAMLTEIRI